MESIKFNTNSVELYENFSKKIRTIVSIMMISLFSVLPKDTEAQTYPQIIPDSSTMEVKNPLDTLNPSLFQAVRESVLEQRKWILEYLNSDKYLERLAKEYFYFKKMAGDTEDDFYKMKDFIKVEKNKDGDTTFIYNFLGQNIQILKGDENQIDWGKMKIENFLNKPDLASLTKEDWEKIKALRDKRFENVKNGRWMIVESISGGLWGRYSDFQKKGFYNFYTGDGLMDWEKQETKIPLAGLSFVKNTFLDEKINLVATHEIGGHNSLDAEKDMLVFTKMLMSILAKNKDHYFNDPTEVYARIFVFRAKLAELGLHDSKKEDFSTELWQKIKEDEEKYNKLLENQNVEELFKTLEEDEIIWLMNNVADMGDYYFISPEEVARNIEKQKSIG